MRSITLAACAAVLLGGAGCEKAGPHASGKLSRTERALLAHLPADADFAFGGNMMRIQRMLQGGPVGASLRQAESMAPGTLAWTECFAKLDGLVMTGAIQVRGMEMRYVMKGITVDDVARCAKAAGFATRVDTDRRFITIETRGALAQKLGYLVLDDGAIYGKKRAGLELTGDPGDSTRAALEADAAAIAKRDLTSNAKLVALIERADRGRGLWVAGSGDGTLLADKVGAVIGSLDFGDSGLRLDVVVDTHGDLAREAVDGFERAKSAAPMLGRELSDLLDGVELSRSGDRLHVTAKLSNAQLETMTRFMKRGGGLGGGTL